MKLFFLIALLISSSLSAKAYKCDIDGKKVYQMHPCPEEGQGSQINVKDKQPVITGAERLMRQKNDKEMGAHFKKLAARDEQLRQRRKNIVNQIQADKKIRKKDQELAEVKSETGIAPGMTESQVRSELGEPSSINQGQYNAGSTHDQQWVYRDRKNKTRYIYFDNGIVTSQQW